MTGLHYPDDLYADHEERKARRSQAPTGAYRAPAEIPEAERKLRTALAYVNHARDLIRDALGDNEPKTATPEPERVPKWDPRWGEAYSHVSKPQHPMNAETIRDHDERLAGGESNL